MVTNPIKTLGEQLAEKWKNVIDCEGLPKIDNMHKRNAIAIMLENQENACKSGVAYEQSGATFLHESAPTNSMNGSSATAGGFRIYDPVLISMIRRVAPNMVAFDLCGTQPMTAPTGLVFALRARYKYANTTGAEALYNEANTGWGAENSSNTFNFATVQTGDDAAIANSSNYTAISGMTTAQLESLGGASGEHFNEMAFTIERFTIEAKARALKAEFTDELVQDLKSVHGLDAESELANITTTEILAEINREVIRKINISATIGAQQNTTTAGTFDMNVDSNGRWMVEKFKGLLYQVERECNAIAKATRRGKGNFLVCSSDLASAFAMLGVLDYNPAMQANLNVDDTGNTFAGVINGRLKVYVDPYFSSTSNYQYFTAGYKGVSPFDAGMFYCPYVPLYMVRAIGQDTFQPKIGFKTRYGLSAHPFATTAADGTISFSSKNCFFRRVCCTNIM